MKRIGILTYFWGVNPGTALQAYSMLSLIKNRFKDDSVEIINYQPKKAKTKFIRNYLKIKSSIRYLKQISAYNIFRKNSLKVDSTPLITKDYLEVINFIKEKYDIIIVGSDTVWEITTLKSKNLAPFPNIYWLSPKITAKKIAFSVSAGTTTLEDLDKNTLEILKILSNCFDLIGVRDDITEKLIRGIDGVNERKIFRSPDPTFTYEMIETGVTLKLIQLGLDLNKPIAGINLPPLNGFRQKLTRHLLQKGFQVLSISDNILANDIFILPSVTPFEWADLYKHFKITITDRFHGTIFSLKNLTPVIAIDCISKRFTADGDSKTLSLLKEFDLENRCHFNINDAIQNPEKLYKSIENAIIFFDEKNIRIKLEEMKMRCEQFLDRIQSVIYNEHR